MSLNSITEVRDKGIPKFAPGSLAHEQFWTQEFNYCTNGIGCGNFYIPGELYFYLNYWKIKIDDPKLKVKKIGLPLFRDIEWMFFVEALQRAKEERKGICFLSARGIGKSFLTSGVVGANFSMLKNNEILISAGEENDLNTLMSKITFGLQNLPLEMRQTLSRDNPKEEIRSGIKFKDGDGNIVYGGRNNSILIRNYKNNPMAANGTRPKIHIFEEAGKHHNLIECYTASSHCWIDGNKEQFGIPIVIGTGGDMEKGTADFASMFYDPDTYNLITYEFNEEEESNPKVSLFIPATYSRNSDKEEVTLQEYLGTTDQNTTISNTKILKSDVSKTKTHFDNIRERLKKSKNKTSYYKEIQYNPFYPKEAFLIDKGNIFNRIKLSNQRALLRKKDPLQRGFLRRENNKVIWVPDEEGWLLVLEHPVADNEPNLYVAGTDPYAIDKTTYSRSLGSTFVYKTFRAQFDELNNIFVAEYTDRPDTQEEYFDNLMLILQYYGCKTLYENNITKCYDYFRLRNKLQLLAKQPNQVLKSIMPNSQVTRDYGIHMTSSIKQTGEMAIADYIESYCHQIYFEDLITELDRYNPDGNFDRVIAMMMCLFFAQQLHHQKKEGYTKRTISIPTYRFVGNQLKRNG